MIQSCLIGDRGRGLAKCNGRSCRDVHLCKIFKKLDLTNSADPDETPHNAGSALFARFLVTVDNIFVVV